MDISIERSSKNRPKARQKRRKVTRWATACFIGACITALYFLVVHTVGEKREIDLSTLARPIPLTVLREIGEDSALRHPGLDLLSTKPLEKESLKAFDERKATESCTPAGPNRKVVLVTGAAGFIGMHSALVLRQRGDGVLGLDNFNNYYPVSLKRARQAALTAEGVHIVDGDLNDAALLRRIFGLCAFTHVLHLAAQAGVRYAAQNPQSYVSSNVAGWVSLLEVVKAQPKVPAVVYASSSSVYGLNNKQPFSETDRVDRPASLYAATKRAGELLAHTYFNIHGLSLTGLRFFTVYGPWGRPDMAAYKFAVAIMKGDPIPLFQGPNGTELSRDFTYIDDVVRGVLGAIDTAAPSGKATAQYRLFNLGDTQPRTVSQLVGLLERALQRTAIRNRIPVPATGDVLATFADISAARASLGYDPQVPLETGIKRFAEWFFEYYGGGSGVDGAQIAADWSYKPV